MTEEHTNFLGLRVEGDITRGTKREKQRPREELGPLIEAVLHHPKVEALRWRQYTPYFNDGEACEFSTGELCVRFVELEAAIGGGEFYYEDGFISAYEESFTAVCDKIEVEFYEHE